MSSVTDSAFTDGAATDSTATSVPVPLSRSKQMRQRLKKRVQQPVSDRQVAATSGTSNSTKTRTILQAKDIFKDYTKGKLKVPVLKGVSFGVNEGEFCAIIGKSGSGKSTLLHLLGTLDAPTSGEVHFQGERIDNISARRRDRIRNEKFGLIFQFYHLLPELTTLENVLMPKMISDGVLRYWKNKRNHTERARHLLEIVGLSHRLKHRPSEMSGGEMQRVAIARALISDPELLLADEPTGNLDAANGAEVLAILDKLREREKLTIVMVTHDDSIATRADRCINLVSGRVCR